jgi:hypothetical protein
MPAISAMIDVIGATAAIGEAARARPERASALDARAIARRLYRRGGSSFYAATALRLSAQAEWLLGDPANSAELLARATTIADARGGKVDRLAVRALAGSAIAPGPLGAAVAWSTGGMIDGEHGWQVR